MSAARIPEISDADVFERARAIKRESHTLAVAGTQRAAAEIPVPECWEHWAVDLRRGRLSVLGGFFRFVDLLAARNIGTGRKIALALIELATEYVDLALPEQRPTVVGRPEQITEVIEIQQRATWRKVGR